MNVALHAEDTVPIAPARLAGVPSEAVGRLTVQLDPSAVWLRSPWPVDRIWQANQSDADDEVPVDMGLAARSWRSGGRPTTSSP
jgi:hypothetical protein